MSSVKFINEIIWIYFSPRTFQLKVNQCYPTFHWSWNVWEMFSLISFLKNFSRMKPWWREELQLPAPVTIKRSFLGSCKWNKLFERYRQLRLLPKHFICQSYFMFQIIFIKWKKMQKYCSKPHPPPGMNLPGSGLTASAPMSGVSAPACTNGVWPPLRPVSMAQKNKPSTMLSSNVQSIDLPMDCMAWRFWTMRQPNGCSTHAPRSSADKQWFEQLAQKKKAKLCTENGVSFYMCNAVEVAWLV